MLSSPRHKPLDKQEKPHQQPPRHVKEEINPNIRNCPYNWGSGLACHHCRVVYNLKCINGSSEGRP